MSGSRLMTEDMVLTMIQKVTTENDSKFKIMEKKFDDRIKLLEIRVELLEDVTLGPIINNTAVQVLNKLFTSKIYPPSKRFVSSSSNQENKPIVKMLEEELNCKMADIDALINKRNTEIHLSDNDLMDMILKVRKIVAITPKFSDDLFLSLSIISKYEKLKKHFDEFKK
jgi:hypothetical protein